MARFAFRRARGDCRPVAVGLLVLCAGTRAPAADDKAGGPPPVAESAAKLTAKPGFDIDGDPLPPA